MTTVELIHAALATVQDPEFHRGGVTMARNFGLDTPRETRRSLRGNIDPETFGRLSERFARFLGTARFLVYMTAFVLFWVLWNSLAPQNVRFDEYPFIFLTLILSLQASYAAPLILLAQNRQADLDLLYIDLPPGTGDLAISLGQLVPSSEIVVVTTPQVAAAEVAERAGRIAHQIHQRVIGVIENMSAYPCAKCGELTSLFGEGGGEETSRRLSQLVGADVPLLGKIPFSPDLREGGDAGAPVVVSAPDSPSAKAIEAIVSQLIVREKSLLGVRLGLA